MLHDDLRQRILPYLEELYGVERPEKLLRRIIDVIDCNLPPDRTLDTRESSDFAEIAHRVRAGLRAGHSYDD